ncbi:MAG: hypothetical protein R3D51_15265 [Hyphomicrobiaceae bacterium]
MRIYVVLFVAMLTWWPVTPSFADALVADGVKVDLKIPEGYCSLSRDHPAEKPHYDQQDRMQAKINAVMLIALPCEEIADARAGRPWKRWVIWLLNGPPGHHTKIPPNMTRQVVIEQLAHAMPTVDIDTIGKDIGGVAAKEGLGIKLHTMSMIGKDDVALYTAQAAKVSRGDAGREIAVVTGWVAMGGRLFTANTYADLEGVATVEGLLAQAKTIIKSSADSSDVLNSEGTK